MDRVYQVPSKKSNKPLNTHQQEESLDSMVLRIQSLLDQIDKVQSIFKDDRVMPISVQKELANSKQEVKRTFEALQKKGVPILKLLSTFGEKILRYQIINADEKLEEIQNRERSKQDATMVVDVVNEEEQLDERQQQQEEEDEFHSFLEENPNLLRQAIREVEEEKQPLLIRESSERQRRPLPPLRYHISDYTDEERKNLLENAQFGEFPIPEGRGVVLADLNKGAKEVYDEIFRAKQKPANLNKPAIQQVLRQQIGDETLRDQFIQWYNTNRPSKQQVKDQLGRMFGMKEKKAKKEKKGK